MDFSKKFAVKPGTRINLDETPTDVTGGMTKEYALKQLAANQKRINELQELL